MNQRLAEIETRLTETSPGPWEASRGATSDGSEFVTTEVQKAAFLALSLNDDESPLWLVVSDEVIPAATGDGPKAQANAEFIANAPTDIVYLLDLARKQAAALEAVKVIEQRLERSMQGEDREIAEDIRAALAGTS